MTINSDEVFEYEGIDDLTFRSLRYMQHDEMTITLTTKEYRKLMHDLNRDAYSFTIKDSKVRGPNGLNIIFNVKERKYT
jgi:hypothetical protein